MVGVVGVVGVVSVLGVVGVPPPPGVDRLLPPFPVEVLGVESVFCVGALPEQTVPPVPVQTVALQQPAPFGGVGMLAHIPFVWHWQSAPLLV